MAVCLPRVYQAGARTVPDSDDGRTTGPSASQVPGRRRLLEDADDLTDLLNHLHCPANFRLPSPLTVGDPPF
jgi:hypothetical protein